MSSAPLPATSRARRWAAAELLRKTGGASAAIFVGMMCASTLEAQEQGSWTLRLQLSRTLTDEQVDSSSADERRHFHLSGSTGAATEIEYRLRRRLGVTFRLDLVRLDSLYVVDLETGGSGDPGDGEPTIIWAMEGEQLELVGVTLGVQQYLRLSPRIDWFVGAFGGVSSGDEATFSLLGAARPLRLTSSELLGLRTGIDVRVREGANWALNLTLEKAAWSPDLRGETSGRVDLDPTTVRFGVAYTFGRRAIRRPGEVAVDWGWALSSPGLRGPDLVGKTLDEAKALMSRLGLELHPASCRRLGASRGDAIVTAQQPAAHDELPRDGRIRLECRSD